MIKKTLIVASTIALVLVVLLFVLSRFFHQDIFVMSGESMMPTVGPNEELILSDNVSSLTRGDIIVFEYPYDHSKLFIKRIVGMPGETITLTQGYVTITTAQGASFPLDESYVAEENRIDDNLSLKLGAEEYFVLGDNRAQSSDSRVWGPVTRDRVVGVANTVQ